ncbi:replication protein A [Sphingomonas oryzagri]|uniref:Replication protein A n=1 Tax=Sphingomonas oryzagri TaxID=3042314 RepID=A0ABT6N7W0_9SPHN|nr:replication protein A [Sphingomonas oryzagri]MDH7641179.1 replication protein A [Sphingomonas oryzagri]
MAAASLFEIATGVQHKAQRSFQFVRRHSYYANDRRALSMWKPLDLQAASISQRLRAAEEYERLNREPGKRNGPLGHIAIEVLRAMYRVVCRKTGRLEPSIAYLEEKLHRSRAAIVRALDALKRHGFLDWVRRSEPIEDAGQGPQVKQITNAYALLIPHKAMQFIKHMAKAAPLPVDDEDRRKAAKAEHEAMLASLPTQELPAQLVDDRTLSEVLSSLGASLSVSDASSPKSLNPTRKVQE